MQTLFDKKALATLKECNRRILPSLHGEGFDILWFQLYHRDEDRARANLKMHRHTFYELHIVLHGCVSYSLPSGETLTAGDNECLLFPPGSEHRLIGTSALLEKAVLAFTETTDGDIRCTFAADAVQIDATDWLGTTFSAIVKALHTDNGTEGPLLFHTLSSLVLQTAQSAGIQLAIPAAQEDERLTKAKRFIADNSTRNLSVQEIAAAVYLSVKQLERLFHEQEHCRVSEYIAVCRCAAAKALLVRRELSVAQVAEQLSFSNVYNFSRFFKRMEGIPPGIYRDIVSVKHHGTEP